MSLVTVVTLTMIVQRFFYGQLLALLMNLWPRCFEQYVGLYAIPGIHSAAHLAVYGDFVSFIAKRGEVLFAQQFERGLAAFSRTSATEFDRSGG